MRRLSSNKIYLSKGEFKHTNNKVIITLYTFNRQKNNLLIKLRKRLKKILLKNNLFLFNFKYIIRYFNKPQNKYFIQKSKLIKLKKNLINHVYNKKIFIRPQKLYLLKKIYLRQNHIKIRLIRKGLLKKTALFIHKLKNLETKFLPKKLVKLNKNNKAKVLNILYNLENLDKLSWSSKGILRYIRKFNNWKRKKYLKKISKYLYYKQLIYINKSKFNYTYLQYLKNYLQILFNKNVEFTFINLRKYYLNSNILSESLIYKIKKKRNKLWQFMTKLKDSINIKKKVYLENSIKYNVKKNVIKNLKYKHISGYRVETKGRLTRRNKAERSVYKLKYKGNLLNLDTSYASLSGIYLKGNLDSNLQYTKLKNKTKIGSFGLKGWVSGN